MGHEGKKCWSVKGQNYTHMGATSAECLHSGIPGREAEDSMEDIDIGDDNGYDVKHQNKDGT